MQNIGADRDRGQGTDMGHGTPRFRKNRKQGHGYCNTYIHMHAYIITNNTWQSKIYFDYKKN